MTNARRLSIVVDEDAVIENRPVYTRIVSLAYEAGLSGASVFRGIEGFGATRRVHTSRLLSVSENMPVLIVIIDTADAIEQFLPMLGAELQTETHHLYPGGRHLGHLFEEGAEQGVVGLRRGHVQGPGLHRRRVRDLPGPARPAAGLPRHQETLGDQGADVVQHTRRVPAETCGDLLVGQRLVPAHAQDAQPEHAGERTALRVRRQAPDRREHRRRRP